MTQPTFGFGADWPRAASPSPTASAIVAGCAVLVKERTGQTGARLKGALVQAAEPKPGLGAVNNRRLSCGKAIP